MLHIDKLSLKLAGVIHPLRLSGVIGADRLLTLYGVAVDEPNLLLLMRHRAVLFGMLGAFLIAASCLPPLRTSAFVLGLCSVASFLLLAWSGPGWNGLIGRVVAADAIALAVLLAGGIAHAVLSHAAPQTG